jgi:hypothetical protein
MCWTIKGVGCWLVLLAACGCGARGSLPLAPVNGTVTYKGKPLEHGQVVFNPSKNGAGVLSVGFITGNGSFEMQTGSRKGAPLGEFVVTVHCRQKPSNEQGRDLGAVRPSLIPEKYSVEGRSPLRFEVKAGSNVFPIVLE